MNLDLIIVAMKQKMPALSRSDLKAHRGENIMELNRYAKGMLFIPDGCELFHYQNLILGH